MDVANSKRYLVDSGSAFSILPHKSSAEPTGPRPMTADGKLLHCWGRCTCSVCTMTREFSWTFLLAPVAFPILGADFLSNFRLLVDISNKRLVARGGKLIQLEQGEWTKVAVATGVVAAAPPPAVFPSTPSLPTVEAPSSSFSGPPAASWHSRAARKLKVVAAARRRWWPLYTFTSHSGGTQQQLLRAARGQPGTAWSWPCPPGREVGSMNQDLGSLGQNGSSFTLGGDTCC